MKTKLLVITLTLAVLASALFYFQNLQPKPLEKAPNLVAFEKQLPFPDVTFTTPDAKKFKLRDLKEETVLVHFWAAWCTVCHAEFPQLLKYVEASHGKVALIALSMDEHYADSEKFLKSVEQKYGLSANLPHVYWAWDENKNLSLHHFNTVRVPETIIVNKDRLMVDKIIGVGPWAEAQRQ